MAPVVIFVVVRTRLVGHASTLALVIHEAAVGVRLGDEVLSAAGRAIRELRVTLPESGTIDTRTTLFIRRMLCT